MSDQSSESVEILDVERLGDGYPGLKPTGGINLAHACSVCLEERSHVSGLCQLTIRGGFEAIYTLAWPEVDDQMLRQWDDEQEATEDGAVGMAILVVTKLTEYQIVRRSRKGTGVDYYLGRKSDSLFQHAARLEVSGVRAGSKSIVDGRVRQKIEQTKRSDGLLPAFIAVVEFGTPVAVVIQR